uniref:GUN4-like domain-containing protein n=1 Tax=Gronococcus sybilensis TaxID=3028029 RepID=A0A9Y1MXG8_9RHOD|nr:hypothetical protein GRSY_036 [Gronococcus sybilensis]
MNNSTIEVINLITEYNTSKVNLTDKIAKIENSFSKNLIDPIEMLEFLNQEKLSKELIPTYLHVHTFHLLKRSKLLQVQQQLKLYFPQEFVSCLGKNPNYYSKLESLLSNHDFFEADRVTQGLLSDLAVQNCSNRKWLYFTEVRKIKNEDLYQIDLLWDLYSQGQFGISIQKKLWLTCDKNWQKFWEKIGWINHNDYKKYPEEFTWNLQAPKGHLPLFNQLRGVETLEALFNHPVWTSCSPTT